MTQFCFLVLFLILADTFVLLATANETAQNMLVGTNSAGLPSIRKLGKHQNSEVDKSIVVVSAPSEAPQAEGLNSKKEVTGSGQDSEIETKKQHHTVDRSVAGGGVILGGLATTFFVAIFCYIRATRRKTAEPIA